MPPTRTGQTPVAAGASAAAMKNPPQSQRTGLTAPTRTGTVAATKPPVKGTLPRGLAKRASLPPGLAKRATLPPGLAKRATGAKSAKAYAPGQVKKRVVSLGKRPNTTGTPERRVQIRLAAARRLRTRSVPARPIVDVTKRTGAVASSPVPTILKRKRTR